MRVGVCLWGGVGHGGGTGTVYVGVPSRARVEDILALWAEELTRVCPWDVALPHREHRLPLTKDARASAKVDPLELFEHTSCAAGGDNVTRVDEPVQELRGRLDRILLILREPRLARRLHIEDRVQRVLVVRHLHAEAGEVKIVLDKILVHLHKELIPLERAEPVDPVRVRQDRV